ncbi:MAG: monofunctional biosynthetic peptidoglycan transglycosylase [Gammaproteobacteria bacterium]|nr:monofunctional biosynthetic peptidoglycan transglycosylase [Gammaproteobacteria bacterium]MDE2262568.1 monofunctional biosynthetic peptidoglycan transglycosylase [Gammaproteobacteria bacterium]
MSRGGFRRLRKWALLAILAWVALTVVPVLLLRWLAPVTSAFMLEARVEALREGARGYRTDYRWVSLERISPHAAIAVIASEDQTFPFNYGFDFHSIRSAVRAAQRGKRLRGASTISQQVARNLFLWPGRSFVRKGIEAYFTVLLEALWPKERILEVYLNVAQFGRGIYGVEAAARRFYHEPAARLTAGQAALLAAVLPDPVHWHVDRPSRFVAWKQQWILAQMRNLGGAAYLREVKQNQ